MARLQQNSPNRISRQPRANRSLPAEYKGFGGATASVSVPSTRNNHVVLKVHYDSEFPNSVFQSPGWTAGSLLASAQRFLGDRQASVSTMVPSRFLRAR